MNIPDPIDRMDFRIDSLIYAWDAAQDPSNGHKYTCPYCKSGFDYDPISISADPDAPVMCYDCLPDDEKEAYDKWMAQRNTSINHK